MWKKFINLKKGTKKTPKNELPYANTKLEAKSGETQSTSEPTSAADTEELQYGAMPTKETSPERVMATLQTKQPPAIPSAVQSLSQQVPTPPVADTEENRFILKLHQGLDGIKESINNRLIHCDVLLQGYYNLHLVSVDENTNDLPPFQDLPVLIKRGDEIYIYGMQANGERTIVELDKTKLESLPFPEIGGKEKLLQQNEVDSDVYEEIAAKKGHTALREAKEKAYNLLREINNELKGWENAWIKYDKSADEKKYATYERHIAQTVKEIWELQLEVSRRIEMDQEILPKFRKQFLVPWMTPEPCKDLREGKRSWLKEKNEWLYNITDESRGQYLRPTKAVWEKGSFFALPPFLEVDEDELKNEAAQILVREIKGYVDQQLPTAETIPLPHDKGIPFGALIMKCLKNYEQAISNKNNLLLGLNTKTTITVKAGENAITAETIINARQIQDARTRELIATEREKEFPIQLKLSITYTPDRDGQLQPEITKIEFSHMNFLAKHIFGENRPKYEYYLHWVNIINQRQPQAYPTTTQRSKLTEAHENLLAKMPQNAIKPDQYTNYETVLSLIAEQKSRAWIPALAKSRGTDINMNNLLDLAYARLKELDPLKCQKEIEQDIKRLIFSLIVTDPREFKVKDHETTFSAAQIMEQMTLAYEKDDFDQAVDLLGKLDINLPRTFTEFVAGKHKQLAQKEQLEQLAKTTLPKTAAITAEQPSPNQISPIHTISINDINNEARNPEQINKKGLQIISEFTKKGDITVNRNNQQNISSIEITNKHLPSKNITAIAKAVFGNNARLRGGSPEKREKIIRDALRKGIYIGFEPSNEKEETLNRRMQQLRVRQLSSPQRQENTDRFKPISSADIYQRTAEAPKAAAIAKKTKLTKKDINSLEILLESALQKARADIHRHGQPHWETLFSLRVIIETFNNKPASTIVQTICDTDPSFKEKLHSLQTAATFIIKHYGPVLEESLTTNHPISNKSVIAVIKSILPPAVAAATVGSLVAGPLGTVLGFIGGTVAALVGKFGFGELKNHSLFSERKMVEPKKEEKEEKKPAMSNK